MRMKSTILWGLVALNVVLLITFVGQYTSPNTAHAQAGAGARRPADYLMIPGEVTGGTSSVVYMIDTSNGLLGAMTYDDSVKQLNTMPPIELKRVFDQGGGQPPRGAAVAPGARAPGR